MLYMKIYNTKINLNRPVFFSFRIKSKISLYTEKSTLHKQGVFFFTLNISECICLCLCVCSCTTCRRADFRLRQQDLGQHRTRGSHRRTGRPASPHLQNLDKPPSTEKSGLNITTALSHCNYAPLCMPLQPRVHTHC